MVIIGVILLISGFFGLLGLVSSMVIGHSFVSSWPIVWSPEVYVPGFLDYFVGPGIVTFGLVLVGIIAGIPLLAMLYAGTKLVFRYKSNNAAILLSMLGVWFVSLVVLISISFAQLKHFKDQSSVTVSKIVECDSCETLYLNIAENKYEDYAELDWNLDGFDVYMVNGEEVLVGDPQLNIVRSGSDEFVVTVKSVARGGSRDEAKVNSQEIVYNYTIADSSVVFDPYFFLEKDGKWRRQEVFITVKVPEGKAVYLADGLEDVIHDIENTSNTWDSEMIGKFWEMMPEGLTLRNDSVQ